MKIRALLRRAALAAAALGLAGCQMTTFEAAPIAALDCDPGLAGHWLSVDEDPAKRGELVLRVGDDCQVVVDSRERDGVRTSEPTALHLGQHGLYRYAWVDARWALALFDSDHAVPASDVYLLRMARDGERLTLWTPQDKAIARAVIDGELEGEVSYRNRDLFNRLTGTGKPAVLDHPGLFNADPIAFVRAPVDSP